MKVMIGFTETVAVNVYVDTELSVAQLHEVTEFGVPRWRVLVNDELAAKRAKIEGELVDYELEAIEAL